MVSVVDARELSVINQRTLAVMHRTQRNAPEGCPAVLTLVSQAEDGGVAGLAVVRRLRDQEDDLISNLSRMDPLKAEEFPDQGGPGRAKDWQPQKLSGSSRRN
jgi:hypothetical protein